MPYAYRVTLPDGQERRVKTIEQMASLYRAAGVPPERWKYKRVRCTVAQREAVKDGVK